MELKVWVEGIQRVVCGVTEATTCQDVVFALAHATNKIGRFTLIERWRNNERHLAPNENPLKILMKWGEYSNDVQFILIQSEAKQTQPTAAATTTPAATPTTNATPLSPQTQQQQPQNQNNNNNTSQGAPLTNRQPMIIEAGGGNESKPMITPPRVLPGKVVDLNSFVDKAEQQQQKKTPTFDYKENIGIVRGVPQQKQNESPLMQHVKPAGFVLPTPVLKKTGLHGSSASHSPQSSIDSNNFMVMTASATGGASASSPSKRNFNSMDVRNNLVDRLCNNSTGSGGSSSNNTAVHLSSSSSPLAGDTTVSVNRPLSPIISNNGALVPPPYRDPPPPTMTGGGGGGGGRPGDELGMLAAELEHQQQMQQQQGMRETNQYRDLVQLIKLQRDQMTMQQMDISKLDQEIEMLEQRDRDHASQMEALAREILEQDQLLRHGADQLQSLQYVEEEGELMRQQEKTLGAEIALLRSKLANCETELLQCRNKVKLLVDEIQLEQRAMQFESRTQMEAQILGEMERLQGDIEHIVKKSEGTIGATSSLKHEISFLEGAIADKKKQVEQLVHEMKEVNLQSLSVAQPSEEIRHLLEGSTRPGSTRRIIGSPRQLENAVPTSKNPHGVWV